MADQFLSKIYQYTVVFEPAEEGGFVVYVPALPGCATQGENLEEAVKMVKDAIKGYLAVLKKHGEEIPVEPEGTLVSKVSILENKLV